MADAFASAPALHATANLGSLSCTVWQQAAGAPCGLVVLCHGYGASGTDLVGLAEMLARPLGVEGAQLRFLFPQAPVDLAEQGAPQGRAWWPLDVEALMHDRAQGPTGLALLRERTFDGAAKARRALQATIELAMRQADLTWSQVVLGGFSQGAMVTTDLALRLDEPPAGLVILSGTLIDRANWQRLAQRRAGLRVVQSHGKSDPLLPFDEACRLRDLLLQAGCLVEFESFNGGHTIDAGALSLVRELLRARLGQSSSD